MSCMDMKGNTKRKKGSCKPFFDNFFNIFRTWSPHGLQPLSNLDHVLQLEEDSSKILLKPAPVGKAFKAVFPKSIVKVVNDFFN